MSTLGEQILRAERQRNLKRKREMRALAQYAADAAIRLAPQLDPWLGPPPWYKFMEWNFLTVGIAATGSLWDQVRLIQADMERRVFKILEGG